MRGLITRTTAPKSLLVIVLASLLVATGPFAASVANAADLTPRSITMADSIAGSASVIYELSFTYATASTVGSLRVQFCSEGPLPNTTCTPPAGFDASTAALATQTGVTGFAVLPAPANELLLSRPPGAVAAGATAVYTFSGLHNPSNLGSFYARVATYASSDGSGPFTDFGGLALSINEKPTISAEVPPFLLFCLGESISALDCSTATDPFSDMGDLGPLVTGAAQSQMIAGTNADGGYSMWVIGGTMTSGNNTIPAMAGGSSQKGVSQFGINLRANTDPIVGQDVSGPGSAGVAAGYNQQNQFRYQSGDTLASVTVPDNVRKYTVSYIVNVDANQPGGVYATTLTYIALANF